MFDENSVALLKVEEGLLAIALLCMKLCISLMQIFISTLQLI